MNDAEQIEALAQMLKAAEAKETSYHHTIATDLFDQGVRVHKVKYRIDESYLGFHGNRVVQRLGGSFDTREEAERYVSYVKTNRLAAAEPEYTIHKGI